MSSRFLDGIEKTLKLPKEDMDFLYLQLTARKMYFEDDMIRWADEKDLSEIRRCMGAIDKIQEIQRRILNG
jgi:hypothetical protein